MATNEANSIRLDSAHLRGPKLVFSSYSLLQREDAHKWTHCLDTNL